MAAGRFIKNLYTAVTKSVTLKMPKRTGLNLLSSGFDKDGNRYAEFGLEVDDTTYPLKVYCVLRRNQKTSESVLTIRSTTRAVELDADDVVIQDKPLSISTTFTFPGISGLWSVTDMSNFLENHVGYLFTDVTSGQINLVILAHFANDTLEIRS
jgi:hypothetical protein